MNFFTLLSDINTKEINIKLNEDGTITIATVQKKQETIDIATKEIETLVKKTITPEEIAIAEKAIEEVKPEPVVKPVKQVKVDNLKPLKEFRESIKDDPSILPHEEKLEELLANLSPEEADKPLPKKVRIDLDIALRKQKQIEDARAKLYGSTTPDFPDTPQSTPVVEATIPNEVPTVGAEPEQSTANMKVVTEEDLSTEELNAIDTVISNFEPTPIIVVESAPAPMAIPMPLPTAPTIQTPVPVFETITELVMIQEQYTHEQLATAGWTDQQMIDNGYAAMESRQVQVIPAASAPTKLGYTFPKAFDEPQEETEE